MVTWSTWMPRSASSSSTSRYDSAKRRYHRTASTITSGGKQNPTNADRATGAGRERRVLMATVCPLWARPQQVQQCPRNQMRAGLDLLPTWALEQKAAANRQVIAVMRQRLARGV